MFLCRPMWGKVTNLHLFACISVDINHILANRLNKRQRGDVCYMIGTFLLNTYVYFSYLKVTLDSLYKSKHDPGGGTSS